MPFDAVRTRLFDEIVLLYAAWAQFEYLFGESEERVRMLNACAPWFFALTQRVLLREVLLGISRLTDQEKSGKRDNLVIRSLLQDPAIGKYPGLCRELEAAVARATEAAQSVRKHRNKYIAHLDFRTALDGNAAPLPDLPRRSISAAITALGDAYNVHGMHVSNARAEFDPSPLGGADALVRILKGSERSQRLQVRAGELDA